MDAAVATGNVVVMGPTGMQAKEEWWYPSYMAERCPGLPDWQALLEPACAEAFGTAETLPNGRYLGGPVTWGGFDEERIAALACRSTSSCRNGCGAVRRTGKRGPAAGSGPAVGLCPALAPAKYDGAWVEFPPYEAACYTDPAWGINPDATHDCGKPFGEIWKVAWTGVEENWPGAAAAIRAFSLTNDEMGQMITQVDLDGQAIEAVVAEWMTANTDRWQGWLGQ